jgi:mono/diheme cytochrome c family protein
MSEKLQKIILSNTSKGLRWAIPMAAGVMLVTLMSRPVPAHADAAASYSDTCAKCHGATGKGDGPKATDLKDKDGKKITAADLALTDCAKMAKISDDDMFKELKEGGESVGKSKLMIAYGDAMEDDEIKALVSYVRTFCKK